jgi:4a-hydroxytetrahydrobiopterin dehydratase
VAEAWQEVDGALYKKFVFGFMTRVAAIAEAQNHHPDWSNSWNVVEISLRSHDKGCKVTERDHRLAASIDELQQS